MKHQFIDTNKAQYPVRRLCSVLQVSVSGYYAACSRPPSIRSLRSKGLTERIKVIHHASRATYGAPRVHAELVVQGESCSKNTVARLMRKAAIVPKTVRRFRVTTDSRKTKASPNLLGRAFTAAKPNERWLTDITFIPTRAGWLYLAAILDLHSRAIVGWSMRERIDGKLVMDALGMALERRGAAPDILHSDQGSLYAMAQYRALLAQQGIRQSMSRKGDCWDNAPMESFYATLKGELVEQHDYLTHAEARADIFQFLEGWYNRRRMHSALGYLTPEQKVAAFHAAASAAQHCP